MCERADRGRFGFGQQHELVVSRAMDVHGRDEMPKSQLVRVVPSRRERLNDGLLDVKVALAEPPFDDDLSMTPQRAEELPEGRPGRRELVDLVFFSPKEVPHLDLSYAANLLLVRRK